MRKEKGSKKSYSGYPCCNCVYNEIPSNQNPCFECLSCKSDFPSYEEKESDYGMNN